jgi:hypothetical protein
VPTGPPDEKTGKVKKSKPRVKFDLQGFGAYIPSGFSIGGMPADEPTMIIKIIQEKEFKDLVPSFQPVQAI